MTILIHGLGIVVGLVFVIFGLNGFRTFIPVPELHPFMEILVESGYIYLVKTIELLGGLLLLANRWVPLGLALLAPVVVNIAAYHLFLDGRNGFMGVLLPVALAILLWSYRAAFAPLFDSRARSAGPGLS